MTTLWAQLEPLLARVQKPARYLGCEDGARVPEHGPDRVAWLRPRLPSGPLAIELPLIGLE